VRGRARTRDHRRARLRQGMLVAAQRRFECVYLLFGLAVDLV